MIQHGKSMGPTAADAFLFEFKNLSENVILIVVLLLGYSNIFFSITKFQGNLQILIGEL